MKLTDLISLNIYQPLIHSEILDILSGKDLVINTTKYIDGNIKLIIENDETKESYILNTQMDFENVQKDLAGVKINSENFDSYMSIITKALIKCISIKVDDLEIEDKDTIINIISYHEISRQDFIQKCIDSESNEPMDWHVDVEIVLIKDSDTESQVKNIKIILNNYFYEFLVDELTISYQKEKESPYVFIDFSYEQNDDGLGREDVESYLDAPLIQLKNKYEISGVEINSYCIT